VPVTLNILVGTQRGLAPSPIDEYNYESEPFNVPLVNNEPNTVALLPLLAKGQVLALRSTNAAGTTVYAPTGSKINAGQSYFIASGVTARFTASGVNYNGA